MTAIRHHSLFFLALAAMPIVAFAAPLSQQTAPDSVEMKDGRSLHGLILKNEAKTILFQTAKSEIEIPRSEIRRIRDNPDPEIAYTEITRPGKLPAWRAMVIDMREHDSIHSFQQIPATAIDVGIFKNIPYLSFRVNEQSEFNVYGDPNDPIGIEFGMYGKRKSSLKYQQIVREFLAGHLNSRKEIAALYSISLHGGKHQIGPLTVEITPPKSAEAYGGWWVSVYNAKRAKAARVSDKQYAAVTRPFNEVNHRNGRLREKNLEKSEDWLAAGVERLTGQTPNIRGFYRDKKGVLRLIGFDDD